MSSRLEQLSRHFQPLKVTANPVKVTVTGAAGSIGYALVHMIGQGRLLGPFTPISLTLLELPVAQQQLEGTMMELKDCAFPLLKEIKGTTKYEDGFKDCEIAILVGAKPRGPGMERKDLLGQNALIFKEQGEALNKFANKNVKVLVVGNPANTNALICSTYAPNIPSSNFTALTRLDQNRATSLLSDKLNAPVESFRGIIIWGNHSATQFADVGHGTFTRDGLSSTIRGAISNDEWLQKDFVNLVAKRGAAIIDKRKASSAASAASAVCDHIHDWVLGTEPGQIVSMAVIVEGKWYGLPDKICFSLPCTCVDGKFKVVQGLQWDAFSKTMIEKTLNYQELLEEKQMAFERLK